jgi:hypothetical protein
MVKLYMFFGRFDWDLDHMPFKRKLSENLVTFERRSLAKSDDSAVCLLARR